MPWMRAVATLVLALLVTVVRDPARPTTVLGKYDAGDRLHLNAAGYEAIASAVDLAVFRR